MTILARVDLQVWVRDVAMTVKTVEFDCTKALDAFDVNELPENGDFSDGACNWGDDIFFESIALGLVNDWDGPFDFALAPTVGEFPYDEYIKSRKE